MCGSPSIAKHESHEEFMKNCRSLPDVGVGGWTTTRDSRLSDRLHKIRLRLLGGIAPRYAVVEALTAFFSFPRSIVLGSVPNS